MFGDHVVESAAIMNREIVREMNAGGFAVNVSADNLDQADRLAALKVGPVTTILPRSTRKRQRTPEGRTVIPCRALTKPGVRCLDCGLCQQRNRKSIVGFPAHGTSAVKVSQMASQKELW